jgi:hypothetical protein
MRNVLITLLACGLALVLAGCANPPPQLTVSLSPGTPQPIGPSGALNISATVSNDPSKKGVTWSFSPSSGMLGNESKTSATYRAPASINTNATITITAQSVANPSVSTSLIIMLRAPGPQNVQPIAVIQNPIPNESYINGPFTSVMLCAAGTSKCQVINGILVDTGSVGLRVLKSVLTIPIQTLTQSGGSVNDCISFVGGQFLWGEVGVGDVYLAGEAARGISVQVIADPVGYTVPTQCSNGAFDGATDPQFNGILGVGNEPTDCTFHGGENPCDPSAGTASPPVYFVCFGSEGCGITLLPKAQQVSNPVVSFTSDSNGTILQFPAVGEAVPSVAGTLTFGINTEANNDVGTATVFAQNPTNGFVTTTFEGAALTESFIDSGSNTLYFPDLNGIQVCSESPYYCPQNGPLMLTANTVGYNNVGASTVDFEVDNFNVDGSSNPNAAAFGYLAGANGNSPCQNGTGSCTFDWGLPFFYGRAVFTSIDLQAVAGESQTPWWAY